MQIPTDNPELLAGLFLIVVSIIGLVGGNMTLGSFTLNLGTTGKTVSNVISLAVGTLGIIMIMRELFFT